MFDLGDFLDDYAVARARASAELEPVDGQMGLSDASPG